MPVTTSADFQGTLRQQHDYFASMGVNSPITGSEQIGTDDYIEAAIQAILIKSARVDH